MYQESSMVGRKMKFKPDDIVKSCRKLESGIRLGQEGVRACQLGPFCAPLYWPAEEAAGLKITKEMIMEKREDLFYRLNDDHSDIACKQCQMVVPKRFDEVCFSRIGHVDMAAFTICNLKCSFCDYAIGNSFSPAPYDALAILKEFGPEDVEWDAAVDFNGGEPTLLPEVDDYIAYFTSRRIRIFLYTNSVIFNPKIYEALRSGAIRWICSSLDAGTPSTFLKIKKKDSFFRVIENLTRYAHAGSQGGGRLSVKYIFCDDNCSDDDIAGFTYAMLAIRPQYIWLTFDFLPLMKIPGDSDDFGGYDYSKHIKAYAKMYNTLKKHGFEPGHFTENHLAAVSRQGKILLDRAKEEIIRTSADDDEHLLLENFRENSESQEIETDRFSTNPLVLKSSSNEPEPWSLRGKRVVIAPTCHMSTELLDDPEIRESEVLGFLDRDTVLHGKYIKGVKVHEYGSISALDPDVILVASPEKHRADIVQSISGLCDQKQKIVVLEGASNCL